MEAFLRGCRTALQSGTSRIHVVLGNEACDLDSMVSAIAFAYFLWKTIPNQKTAFVPVLNVPRSEFPLRGECVFLLRESRLPPEPLVFRDEIDLHGLHGDGRLALTLVDHNVLPRGDTALEEVVTEVIDHRPVERPFSPSCAVTAELVGSCATLVTERIIQRAPKVLDRQLASILRSTILLDCINMAPEAGKVTPKDTQCVSLLESKFDDLPPRAATFDSLQKAKFDVSGLTVEQMLRKDMKALSGGDLHLAISAVYLKLEELLERQGLKEAFEEFCRAGGYNVLVLMTISFGQKNEPHRQLAVYSAHSDLRELVCRALEQAENPPLRLEPVESPWAEVAAYRQGNGLASRKKLLPALLELLKAREAERRRLLEEDLPPPTPMNSLVEGCPLDEGLPQLTPEAVLEKFSKMAAQGPAADSAVPESR